MPIHPTAMIVLSSEQLWPNIQGLVHWVSETKLSELFIYQSNDVERSQAPAMRLHRFIKAQFPSVRTTVSLPGGIGPGPVLRQLNKWINALPDHQFIINVTGGTKTMAFGAMLLVSNSRCQLVYREIDGSWVRFNTDPDGIIETTPVQINRNITDDVPVSALIKAQMPHDDSVLADSKSPTEIDLVKLVQRGIETDWDYVRMFDLLENRSKQVGFLFEDFVSGTLLALGIKNHETNYELRARRSTPIQETDMVCNVNGSILILDCKLRGAEEEGTKVEAIGSQIRQAAEVRRSLGGLSARIALIRPNQFLPDAMLDMANAMKVDVIDQRDNWTWFKKLADFVGVTTLPEPVRQAQQLLDGALADGKKFAIGHYRASSPRHIQELDNQFDGAFINFDNAPSHYLGIYRPTICFYCSASRLNAHCCGRLAVDIKETARYLKKRFDGIAEVGTPTAGLWDGSWQIPLQLSENRTPTSKSMVKLCREICRESNTSTSGIS